MIRIAIVDDHAIVRAGLRHFFAEQADFRVAGAAANLREAMDIVRRGEVDVVVRDTSMPGHGGVDAIAAIRARSPELPVLVLSCLSAKHYALTMLRLGAAGYLSKDCDPAVIVDAIRTVARGRKYITASVAECLAETWGPTDTRPSHAQLFERELQVFLRLAQAQTVSHLADSLSLSVKTVSTDRGRVMDKMSLSSHSDLTCYALKHGLIQ